jgi:hypothetical protein
MLQQQSARLERLFRTRVGAAESAAVDALHRPGEVVSAHPAAGAALCQRFVQLLPPPLLLPHLRALGFVQLGHQREASLPCVLQ